MIADSSSRVVIETRPSFSAAIAVVPGRAKSAKLAQRRWTRVIASELQGRSCGFASLGEGWCDTATDVGRLMLTIMGGTAEFERGLIRKRCDEGIARAKPEL